MEKLTFKVNEYEGPLDLILALLSKHQIGIYDINISDLLEQYMAYIRTLRENQMEVASEFLEMASRLVYIKTASLLPRYEKEEDPRAELVGQLLTTLAFGCSIDFSMGLLDWFIPGSALEQWLACLLSIVVLALGVFLEVRAKIFLVAGEGVVSVLAFVTQKKFSLIKNCFDISLVTLAIIISWVEFGTLQGVGAGTVVAAVLVGRFVHLYESRLSFFDRWKVEA